MWQRTQVYFGIKEEDWDDDYFDDDGSAAQVDFYDCVAHDNAANGFYFTNRSRGSCTRCDSYNNIGTNGDAIGNTDGFGAHGMGVVFRYCRSWNNSASKIARAIAAGVVPAGCVYSTFSPG